MGGIAILGGSGGLGVAITRRLAARCPVTIGYHSNEQAATELAEQVSRGRGPVSTAQVDVRDSGSVHDFMAKAATDGGGLDAVVSAVGPLIPLCPLDEVGEDDFRRIYETDVLGSFHVIRHGGRTLKESGGGSIVLLLTTAVQRTLENDGMSGCPKTAVAGLLRQAAREMGPANVRLNGVAPGVIDIGIVHSAFQANPTAQGVIQDCLNRTPLGRMGAPDDVAAMVDFLASPAAAYVSGQIIAVDGGYSA